MYIRGFVRTYSTLLKLDVPRIMATLDGELGQTKKFAEPPPLSDHPRGALDFLMLQLSRIDWRRGVLILGVAVVVLAMILGYVGYRHYRTNDPLKNVKPGVYKAPARNSGDTLPLPPAKK